MFVCLLGSFTLRMCPCHGKTPPLPHTKKSSGSRFFFALNPDNLTLKKTYAAVRVSVCLCLYLYVYLYVGHLLLCLCTLYVSPWESGQRFYRFLVCLTCRKLTIKLL